MPPSRPCAGGLPPSAREAPGSLAGLVTIGLDPPGLAGLASRRPPSAAMPDLTLLTGVIFTAAPADVRKVVISGGYAVADGWHLLVEDVPGRFRPLSAPSSTELVTRAPGRRLHGKCGERLLEVSDLTVDALADGQHVDPDMLVQQGRAREQAPVLLAVDDPE